MHASHGMTTILIVFLVALQHPGLLLDRRLAEALPAGVGDTLYVQAVAGGAGAHPFIVEGIFERPADPNRISRNEYEVRFHLPDLEALLPNRDRVDRFAVTLAPGAQADSAARWIESLAYGTQVFDAAELAGRTSTTFRVISRFHDAIGFVTLLASGIFLLCLMIIRVDERRRDVRTMRLIGISRATVLRSVILEAVLIASIASLAGVALGAVISAAVNAYYGAYYDTTLRFAILTPGTMITAIILGIALGVVAGALAGLRLLLLSPQKLGER